ncbi:hypothetical protein [Streptomyces sp. NPDC002564]|uniref:hypothetical protein n=1 Tax=Streptomyces sp. NPDC002564 TaxID=3364649 RepID=UPI00368C9E71
MRRTTTVVLTAAVLALAGCSDSGDDTDHKAKAKKASPTSAATPKKLDPVWSPKLDDAAGKDAEAVSACQMPSSNACARYVDDIMGVTGGLEDAIDKSGRAYPATTKQINKMKAAETEYTDNGCQGDPTADDPNSQCHGVVTITIGAATLGMTLLTDEAGM